MTDTSRGSRLSVIVPAHDAASSLADCLEALLASDLPKYEWELIVVDDGSRDASLSIAQRLADKVISTGDTPRGPAFARNRGADAARASLLAFVDADVAVHPDALRLMIEAIEKRSDIAAVFGAYDENPREPSTVSQYRNLLHHYVHNTSAGETVTFWAGCGAVKKDAFERAGKFDEQRYSRPQIEDIELGHRLCAGGDKILIDPRIQCTHHKAWRVVPMMVTDFRDRAVPWVRLLAASAPGANGQSPSLGTREVLGSVALSAAVMFAIIGVVHPSKFVFGDAVLCLGLSMWVNRDLYRWFAQKRGAAFATRVIPLHLSYQLVSAAAVPVGLALHAAAPVKRQPSPREEERSEEAPRIFSPEYYARMRDLEANAWWNAGMRDIAGALLQKANLPKSGLMIDAGCGSGQTMTWFLASHPTWKSFGADVAVEGVTSAASVGLEVSMADVTRLPVRSGSADLIISFDVLQHLPLDGGDRLALAEFKRMLKPGGYLLLRTNAQSWPRTIDDPANDFRKYEPDQLESRLKAAGFEIDYLSRANALLGLAEIAREAKATQKTGHGYHGILANVRKESEVTRSLKRSILRMEGTAITRRVRLPFGRSIVALCHTRPDVV